MLLTEAESKTANHVQPQAVCRPRAVVDLVHAGMYLVRNSGGPACSSCNSYRRPDGEG